MQLHKPRTVKDKALSFLLVFSGTFILVFGLFLFEKPVPVQATSSDRARAQGTYPQIVGTTIDSCSLCHTSAPDLNPYGSAYLSNGRTEAALRAIENQDSDGDGFSNIVEINALTFPGNANSKPPQQATATQLPTATRVPPTATAVPPTATRVPPTATSVAPTATAVPPTATRVPPTATSVPPTATRVPPTATAALPIATNTAIPTATGPAATAVPTQTSTSPAATPAPTTTAGPVTPTPSPVPTIVGAPGTVVLLPDADACVNQRSRNKNFGFEQELIVDLSPLHRSYLRFDLSAIDPNKISGAKLMLYMLNSSDKGFSVHKVGNSSWNEDTLTFENAPRGGDTVAKGSRARAGRWVIVDLTKYLKQGVSEVNDDDDEHEGEDGEDGEENENRSGDQILVSMVLYGDSKNGFSFASKENADSNLAPRLVISLGQ